MCNLVKAYYIIATRTANAYRELLQIFFSNRSTIFQQYSVHSVITSLSHGSVKSSRLSTNGNCRRREVEKGETGGEIEDRELTGETVHVICSEHGVIAVRYVSDPVKHLLSSSQALLHSRSLLIHFLLALTQHLISLLFFLFSFSSLNLALLLCFHCVVDLLHTLSYLRLA